MKQPDHVEMEIFRTGDFGPKGSYSEADLEALAADYRPDLLEAPLTFDHAQTGPAFGWVERLRRDGDRLWAVMKGVPDTVIGLVKSGAYKRRSVELFRSAPHSGRPYLRAVSLLGAATPEVKGLRDICFAAQHDTCAVEFTADADEPNNAPPATQEIALPVAAAGPLPSTRSGDHLTRMFSQLRADGYCLAENDAASLQALFMGAQPELSTASAESVTFSQDHVDAGVDCLARLLKQALLRAPLGNGAAPASSATPAASRSYAQFSERVDPGSIALHQATMQIMQAEAGLTYRDALMRVCR